MRPSISTFTKLSSSPSPNKKNLKKKLFSKCRLLAGKSPGTHGYRPITSMNTYDLLANTTKTLSARLSSTTTPLELIIYHPSPLPVTSLSKSHAQVAHRCCRHVFSGHVT